MSGFQLKDFASIAAAIINQLKANQGRLTDFEVGSIIRTLIEANAVEIEELYQKVFAGIMDAIPTAIYKGFDFELVGPAAARGIVTVTFGGPIVDPFTIPAGTIFVAGSTRFTSVAAVDVPAGATSAPVVVVCTVEGPAGNVGANAITATEGYSLPVGSALSNPAFTSGTSGQTEAERKARFVEFITSLSRGTTGSIRYIVKQARITAASGLITEYVSRVGLKESPGYVNIFIYGSNGLPSADLIEVVQRSVDGYDGPEGVYTDGYVAAGVEARVLPMVERVVPVDLAVELMEGVAGTTALKNQIATALAGAFDAVESGGVLLVDQLVNAALGVTGVRKVVAGNNENIVCAANEVLRLGALAVQWSGADA